LNRLLIVPALVALLGGCVVGGEAARHDMEASLTAYKACLAARGPEACEGQRQAYAADLASYRATPKIIIGAGSPPPRPAFNGMGGVSWLAPPTPAPLPNMQPRFFAPAGGGTLMEFGGGAPQLMVPAGGGTFMAMP
jgi:hypothetical protein